MSSLHLLSKVTLVLPGAFKTAAPGNAVFIPQHPAYTKPTLPTVASRQLFSSEERVFPNDVQKGVAKIYELASAEKPPVHLLLGKDCVSQVRAHIAALQAEIDQYESWSGEVTVTEKWAW